MAFFIEIEVANDLAQPKMRPIRPIFPALSAQGGSLAAQVPIRAATAFALGLRNRYNR
jgi:hypothetical protein